MYAFIGNGAEPAAANRGFSGNSGFVVGSEGVVVIDTGISYRHGRRILDAIARVTGKPVQLAINTHATQEFIFGNAAFAERGIPILPDILTNAGGVTVSYFEWVQDLGRLFWGRDEIREKLAEKLNDAFDRVWDISQERDLTLRTAALVAGIREVASALDARGLYP